MEIFNRLPKDLKYIVNDYLKDKTNYNKCVEEFNNKRIPALESILNEINVSWCSIDEEELYSFINDDDFLYVIIKRILDINSKIE